jgi:hypothetical protein
MVLATTLAVVAIRAPVVDRAAMIDTVSAVDIYTE